MEEAERIRKRLGAMPPRLAQVLVRRLVDGQSRAACAEEYGITLDAFDVMLLRAARAYAGDERPSRATPAAELADAEGLAQTLETSGSAATEGELLGLRQHARAVRERLDAAEREAAASPARRREDFLRLALVAAILGLTGYFYLRRDREEHREPRPPVVAPGSRP